MWEPPPPPPSSAHSPDHSRHHQDEFQLCKSAFRLGKFGSFDGKLEHIVDLLDIITSQVILY